VQGHERRKQRLDETGCKGWNIGEKRGAWGKGEEASGESLRALLTWRKKA